MGYLDVAGVNTPGGWSSLEARADAGDTAVRINPQTGAGAGARPPASDDWMARIPWVRSFNIDYYLGVDGISLPLVLLTTGLCFLAIIASWNIQKYVKGYLMLFLLLETGMVGTFLALDFFLFYIFWEVMLLPMYFLIGVWGGPRREYAAIKFFLYTLLGSVFILIALLGFYFTDVRDFVNPSVYKQAAKDRAIAAGSSDKNWKNFTEEYHTFDLITLAKAGRAAALHLHGQTEKVLDAAAAEATAARRQRDADLPAFDRRRHEGSPGESCVLQQPDISDCEVRAAIRRIRHQSAGLPIPHLAAGRPRRSARRQSA